MKIFLKVKLFETIFLNLNNISLEKLELQRQNKLNQKKIPFKICTCVLCMFPIIILIKFYEMFFY